MLVLGAARPDTVKVVGEARLEQLEGAGSFDTHGAEVAHVENRGIVATSEVLGDSAFRVRKRHLPAAEIDESGAETQVLGVQCGVLERHPANLAVASGRYFPKRLKTSRR